jgi:hypothetical protein
MIPLRRRILLFVRLCNDLDATVTLGNVLDYVSYNNKNSVSVALNWLRKNGYLLAVGKVGTLHYIISPKGLRLLRVDENRKQIENLEVELYKLGGID